MAVLLRVRGDVGGDPLTDLARERRALEAREPARRAGRAGCRRHLGQAGRPTWAPSRAVLAAPRSRRLMDRAGERPSVSSASTRAAVASVQSFVADQRQVHEDVLRGAMAGCLGEERGDPQVRRRVLVRAAGERLGDTEHVSASLDAPERNLGGDLRGRPDLAVAELLVRERSRGSFSAIAQAA